MQLSFYAATLVLCAPSILTAQDLNRLDLHNGLDILWMVSIPFQGAPVSGFDPTADLFFKAFPADVLRRCSGETNLMGIEGVNFDTDFFSSETLWAYTITPGVVGTDQTILPTQTGGVLVPGLSTTGTIFGAAGCPKPGYVTGWIYDDLFVDTATGLPTPLIELTADGTTDWVFSLYYPAPGIADHDLLNGPINSCGTTGDVTLQVGGSTDGFGLGNGGENAPNWTGLGNSTYGGFNIGGGGMFSPIPNGNDDGQELSWYFDEPTLTGRVDTDNGDGHAGPETGTAVLEVPLQISSGGVLGSGTTTIGARLYDASADTNGLSVAFFAINVGPTLLDLGFGCLPGGFAGADLSLNPVDPAFGVALSALGVVAFAPDENGRAFADSNQLPTGTGPAWPNLELAWQGFTIDLVSSGALGATQVFKQTLRFNDGL